MSGDVGWSTTTALTWDDAGPAMASGNGDPMAKDVDRALCEIAAEHGSLTSCASKQAVMRRKRRTRAVETSLSQHSLNIWLYTRWRDVRVARECDRPVWDAMHIVCPLQCRLRHGAANDDRPGDQAAGQVEWAGLPINLDLAFSRAQRDKVYVQHLMRKREAQLWRWLPDGTQVCACDIAAEHGHLGPEAGQAYVQSLSADTR
jgi:hypothetical protein